MIRETLETPIYKNCDVLVCGGGFGGISAALAAARMGKKVLLLERQFMLGGLGTAGLITIYLPLCDGYGRQVSFGIAEELLRLSISMGAEARYPANWLNSDDPAGRTEKDLRFEVQYNPNIFAILAEQLLLKEGVEILYGTYAVAAAREGRRLSAVVVENKSGRRAISAKVFVDATGDCDIAHFAGAPTATLKEGNKLAAWYYSLDNSGYNLRKIGLIDIPDKRNDGSGHVQTSAAERFGGLDGEEISRMMQISHASTLSDVIRHRQQGEPELVPTSIATIPQLRMTRRIIGEYCLDESEVHKYFADSIGMVSDWRKRGPVFEVPFSTLFSKKISNLICAGRCTSVTDDMWDIMRVIPCCAVTGQAAGTAAAMTEDFAAFDVSALQRQLEKDGVVLHESMPG